MKDNQYLIGEMNPSIGGRGVDSHARQKMYPPNVTSTSVALGIRDLVESQVSAALARIEEAAKELYSRNVDAITMGGLPPVVFGGFGSDKKIIERIRKAAPVPATTGQNSAVEAIKVFQAKKIILVTPYPDTVNRMVIKFLENYGLETLSLQSANAAFDDYPKLPRSLSYELAIKGRAQAPEARCIYIPCSAWPVSDNIEPIEQETGLPVVGGTQSGVWGVLRLIGIKTPVQGYGRLLREY